jgi:hypothetical protein
MSTNDRSTLEIRWPKHRAGTSLSGAAGGMGCANTNAPLDRGRRVVLVDQPPHVQIAEMMILPVNRY